MKTLAFVAAALLGVACSRPALAQTTNAPGTGGTLGTGGVPGAPVADGTGRSSGLPTAPPNGAVPANATTPVGISGPLYNNGVPARNLDGGTQRADQPRTSGIPASAGSQPVKRLHKGRTNSPSPQ